MGRQNHSTIYDVAAQAGVSPATVSHVLNGTAPISIDTQARVRKVIRELDYRPNANARSLRTAHSRIIGVILQDISSEYYARSVAGVLEVAQGYDYVVLTIDVRFRPEVLEKSVAALVGRRVDGLIFIGGAGDEKSVEMAGAAEVPIVFGDRHVQGFTCVEFNNFQTMHAIVDSLCDMGYKRFGYLGEPLSVQQNLEGRYGGIVAALDERGIPQSDRCLILDQALHLDKMRPAYAIFKAALERMPVPCRPQVVMTSNDMVAQGVISASLRRGLKIPDDIAVFGFDDISIAELNTPSISTVVQDPHLLGKLCFEKLLAKINRDEGASENVLLEQKVVVRQTAQIDAGLLEGRGVSVLRSEP